jgi:hypothetical protein
LRRRLIFGGFRGFRAVWLRRRLIFGGFRRFGAVWLRRRLIFGGFRRSEIFIVFRMSGRIRIGKTYLCNYNTQCLNVFYQLDDI